MIRLVRCVAVAAVICVSTVAAQIPNSGFESWTGVDPDGWSTSNVEGFVTPVTASTTAHSGSIAARGDVVLLQTIALAPILQSGPGGTGFALSERPGGFNGYYQFYPANGDRFGINVVLFKNGVNGTGVGVAAAALSATVVSWTQFSVPFIYSTADLPDLCVIQFQIIGPGTGTAATPHVGSYFLLDDLSFSGTNGIRQSADATPLAFTLDQNYPNPFNPSTTIGFTLPSRLFTRLAVYNALGQEVANLINAEVEPGHHTIVFNADALSSGMYYYRLSAGTNVITRKLIVLK